MTWFLPHLAAVTITVLALLSAVTILQQRRTPQSAVAWLLFIMALPYVAIPLFLALGFRKRGARFKPIAFDQSPRPEPGASRTSDVLANYGVPEATSGNSLQLLTTGEDAYAGLVALCRSARTDLDALFYVVAKDDIGNAFLAELTARAHAGVRVRLLLDRLGNPRPPRKALAALRAAGGEVRYFSPLLRLHESGHLNLRNHRKMVIADGRRVFAGGMNVGAQYMGSGPDDTRWCDLAYLLDGPATDSFHDVFRSDWGEAGQPDLRSERDPHGADAGTAHVQLVPSGPDMSGDPLHDSLVHAIHTATQRVWIATPYFLPTEFLDNALLIAARRRVDVRIMLPKKSNMRLADFARGAYLRSMQDTGCRVEFFEPGMFHAKAAIIDDQGYLGSANFDVRSMLLNFETALFVYDDVSVGRLASWYQEQERRCSVGVPPAGLVRRLSEGFFRLGAPVL